MKKMPGDGGGCGKLVPRERSRGRRACWSPFKISDSGPLGGQRAEGGGLHPLSRDHPLHLPVDEKTTKNDPH